MNTAWIKFSQIILLCKNYCQQKCTNYGHLWLYRGQISPFFFAGFAGLLCCRQLAKASKTFAAGKSFAGGMYRKQAYNFAKLGWTKHFLMLFFLTYMLEYLNGNILNVSKK